MAVIVHSHYSTRSTSISCYYLQCTAGAVAQHRPSVIYKIQTAQT